MCLCRLLFVSAFEFVLLAFYVFVCVCCLVYCLVVIASLLVVLWLFTLCLPV